jgi:signal transduction histidine kinase
MQTDLQLTTRLQALAMRLLPRAPREILLRDVLVTGSDMLGAAKGIVLGFDGDDARLRPVVQQGLSERFVAHFEHRGWAALCDAVAACSPQGARRGAGHDQDLALLRSEGIVEIHSAPLLTRDGRLVGLLSHCFETSRTLGPGELRCLEALARMAADCLERAGIEHAEREAERHKDEFLATLAHELRNPVAAIGNAVELMQRGRTVDLEACARMLDRQVRQLIRLIDDLFDLHRVKQGRVELRRHRQPLQAIVAQALENTDAALRGAGQRVVVQQPDEPLWIDADPQRLAQALTNLLHNASKYADADARPAELTVEHDAAQAVIRLRDHGIGIAADQLTRIFDMFVQVDHPQRRSPVGLGIGLTLVRRLVQLHGGSIEARSEGPGRGSEFLLRLPLAGRGGLLPPPQP